MKEPTASAPPRGGVEQWEETFARGLVARAPEPWVAGHVHVVRGLPDQLDPVPTGGLPFHQLIVPLSLFHATERVAGGSLLSDQVLPPRRRASGFV